MAADDDREDVRPAGGAAETGWRRRARRVFNALNGQMGRALGIVLAVFVVLVIAWQSGLLLNFTRPINGVVLIESPQIYTRERLVNDRFREQAWLETQFEELENRAAIISSYRRDSLQASLSAGGSGEGQGDGGADDATGVEPTAEQELLISADDSFNLQRNVRATVRRALIENELDDRHDLGANSIYQLNFGAAIIAADRTRGIAAVDMVMEPVDELVPLNEMLSAEDGGAACGGLLKLECGYLLDAGLIPPTTEAHQTLLAEYHKWKQLFGDWIRSENSSYAREAEEILTLLRSSRKNGPVDIQLRPYFDDLDRAGAAYMDNMRQVAGRGSSTESCLYDPRRVLQATAPAIGATPQGALTGGAINVTPEAKIYGSIRDFADRCAAFTTALMRDSGANLDALRTSITQEVFGGGGVAYEAVLGLYVLQGEEAGRTAEESEARLLWDQFVKANLKSFNQHCPFTDEVVEFDERGRLAVSNEGKDSLVTCIVNSIIRDYGSHPLSSVVRQELHDDADNALSGRSPLSNYTASRGLWSILISDEITRSRARAQRDTVSVTFGPNPNPRSELYPAGVRSLMDVCVAVYPEVPFEAEALDWVEVAAGSATQNYSLDTLARSIDPGIGWRFLERLICFDAKQRQSFRQAETPAEAEEQDDAGQSSGEGIGDIIPLPPHEIPVGLFRFIKTLSEGQKSFSYAIQPSGSFRLERRTGESTVDLQASLFGQQPGRAAGGLDTTESWIEKQYRVIGYGTQHDSGEEDREERRAKFGWFFFPSEPRGLSLRPPKMESANVKLSAIVSAPAWWRTVRVTVSKQWLEPGSLDVVPQRRQRNIAAELSLPATDESDPDAAARPDEDRDRVIQEFRIDLPLRLEFIRNYFAYSDTKKPSLDRLHIPKLQLRACTRADIVLKGSRLWRSTTVTLGGQKADLIQVMPDMRGIIARFETVDPDRITIYASTDGEGLARQGVPVTIWTSEGQTTILDAASVTIPAEVRGNIEKEGAACAEKDAREETADAGQ